MKILVLILFEMIFEINLKETILFIFLIICSNASEIFSVIPLFIFFYFLFSFFIAKVRPTKSIKSILKINCKLKMCILMIDVYWVAVGLMNFNPLVSAFLLIIDMVAFLIK